MMDNIKLKTGLTACNECKHASSYHNLYKVCLQFPIIEFDHYEGKEYIAGYKNCQDINRGRCPDFEQKPPKQPKKKWWQSLFKREFKNASEWDEFII
jgi:hypothetical protein